MKFLNLGCGGNRPKSADWINLDNLLDILPVTLVKEREQLFEEKNYVNHNLLDPLPFEDNSVDGALLSHVLEHFACSESLQILREVNRVLKPSMMLRVSVPCPKKFYDLTMAGEQNWGVTDWNDRNTDKKAGKTYMESALFFKEHKQLLGLDALKCLFFLSRFKDCVQVDVHKGRNTHLSIPDNRQVFSLFVEGMK